jgi:hypothetical protein
MWPLLLGHFAFGLSAGLLTGMSKSPVVSTVLPLMFAFAGGSVLALTTVAGLTTEDENLLGFQLLWFAIGTIAGVFWGRRTTGLPLTGSRC